MKIKNRHRFGSGDSVDRDVLYVVDQLPTPEECREWCRDSEENRNLVVLRDGVVSHCYKGAPDETNNALYYTHSLHQQSVANPIARAVSRIVPLKVVRVTRMLLSLSSRGPLRKDIKAALRANDQSQRLKVLARLDLAQPDPETAKSMAFQLGQAIALIEGHELYSKADLAEAFPQLETLLYRRGGESQVLNDFRDQFLGLLDDVYVRAQGSLNIFCYKNSVTVEEWNDYCRQSRGTIICLKSERCVTFPYEKFFKLGEIEGWNAEDLLQEPEEIVEKVDGSFISCYSHEGELDFACKGNFGVEQALRAKQISTQYDFSQLDFQRHYYTLEVVYPGNRFPTGFASVDYGGDALFLTGARCRTTHDLLPYAELEPLAERAGLRYPQRFEGTFRQAMAATQDEQWQNFEGWVANFQGKRVKIKLRSYNKLNDVLNGLKHGNGRVLRRYLQESEEGWLEFISVVPEEFQDAVEREVAFYGSNRDRLMRQIEKFIREHHKSEQSQEFIELVEERVRPEYRKIVFQVLRGKKFEGRMRKLMLRKLFSEGRKVVTPDLELVL